MMINFRTGDDLYLDGMTITDEGYSKKTVWDLSQLSNITTLDAIEDDENRKAIIAESKKGNHMLEGAVMGGVADAFIGDDGIVTGVILGALFGSMVEKNVQPEKALARIVLLFNDGTILPLEVDKAEYTKIQAMAIEILKNTQKYATNGAVQLFEKQRIQNSPAYSNTFLVLLALLFVSIFYLSWQGPEYFYSAVFNCDLPELSSPPSDHDLYESTTAAFNTISTFLLKAFFWITFPVLLVGIVFLYVLFYEDANKTFKYSDFQKVNEFGQLEDVIYGGSDNFESRNNETE